MDLSHSLRLVNWFEIDGARSTKIILPLEKGDDHPNNIRIEYYFSKQELAWLRNLKGRFPKASTARLVMISTHYNSMRVDETGEFGKSTELIRTFNGPLVSLLLNLDKLIESKKINIANLSHTGFYGPSTIPPLLVFGPHESIVSANAVISMISAAVDPLILFTLCCSIGLLGVLKSSLGFKKFMFFLLLSFCREAYGTYSNLYIPGNTWCELIYYFAAIPCIFAAENFINGRFNLKNNYLVVSFLASAIYGALYFSIAYPVYKSTMIYSAILGVVILYIAFFRIRSPTEAVSIEVENIHAAGVGSISHKKSVFSLEASGVLYLIYAGTALTLVSANQSHQGFILHALIPAMLLTMIIQGFSDSKSIYETVYKKLRSALLKEQSFRDRLSTVELIPEALIETAKEYLALQGLNKGRVTILASYCAGHSQLTPVVRSSDSDKDIDGLIEKNKSEIRKNFQPFRFTIDFERDQITDINHSLDPRLSAEVVSEIIDGGSQSNDDSYANKMEIGTQDKMNVFLDNMGNCVAVLRFPVQLTWSEKDQATIMILKDNIDSRLRELISIDRLKSAYPKGLESKFKGDFANFPTNQVVTLMGAHWVLDLKNYSTYTEDKSINIHKVIQDFFTIARGPDNEHIYHNELIALKKKYFPEFEDEKFVRVQASWGNAGDAIFSYNENTSQMLTDLITVIRELEKYNQKNHTNDTPKLELWISLDYGPISFQFVGSRRARQLQVSSDAVNTMSRIQSKSSKFGTSILLSSRLVDQIKEKREDFFLRYLGKYGFKGKDELIGVYELSLEPFKHAEEFDNAIKDIFSGEPDRTQNGISWLTRAEDDDVAQGIAKFAIEAALRRKSFTSIGFDEKD